MKGNQKDSVNVHFERFVFQVGNKWYYMLKEDHDKLLKWRAKQRA